jgi:hypothetical protein
MTAEVSGLNAPDEVGTDNRFLSRIARLSDRIDYRIAESDRDRTEIFRLRYTAYVRDGTICPSASGTLLDRYDDMMKPATATF